MGPSRQSTMPPDDKLVTRAQAGDTDAFEHLVKRHQLPLRHYFLRRDVDRTLVDDLVQSTFLTVYTRLDQLRDNHAFLGWFYRIAHNALISDARWQKAHEELSLDSLIDSRGTPDELTYLPAAIEHFPDYELARQALSTMRPMLREAFLLRHYAQCPAREVAEVLSISVPAARKRIARANDYMQLWYATADSADDESERRYA